MTLQLVFLSVFLILFVLKIPVYISMVLTGVVIMALEGGGLKWTTIIHNMFVGINSFTFLAVPMFLLAGKIMNTGGVTTRLFDFCMKLVGWLPGGLGHVNILGSVIFAGMSGTALSDAGGLGQIEIQAMNGKGFDNAFSCSVTAVSSTLGPIIPPSVPLVIYGTLTGTSVGALFMAGIFPGLLMALIMMIVVFIFAILRKYPRTEFPSVASVVQATAAGFLPLMAPVIILGGIYSGFFTPTESAVVVVFYSLFLSVVVYKNMHLNQLRNILRETVRDSISIGMLIAGARYFGYVLVRDKIPQSLLSMMVSVISNQTELIIIILVFLLIIGCFMETTTIMILAIPLILPMLNAFHVNLVQFGVVLVLALMIGLLTPPFGLVLFVISKIGNISIGRLSWALLPWIGSLFVALILIAFIPQISLWLPKTLGLM
ncbi:MAG: TRAP transporter large permease [Prevotellaceae bacterium]|jgi:tripartite ATP-independent transporter DctM subunit|nr:TRAP transporter large permease [Prevotellaceae bacterium]